MRIGKGFVIGTVTLILLAGMGSVSDAAIVSQPVEYKHGETILEGYLFYDDASQEKRPGVMVVHEWRGLNDYAKRRAEQLVSLGYVAFAADMYGKGVYAKDHEEAAQLSGVYRNDRKLMRERAEAGLQVLKGHPLIEDTKLAAIGYCFGGTTVLEMARAGMDVRGVVSFHGGLSAPLPAQAGEVKAKVLVLHGAGDNFVPPQEVENFKAEMQSAKVDFTFIPYEGAVHSFTVPEAGTDPSKGMAYNAEADEKSWQAMTEFFEKIFA